MVQVRKLLCVSMDQIFNTSQNVLKILQTSISPFIKFVFLGSQARQEGLLCSFLEIEMSDPGCWGKCRDYSYPWVNFSLKIQFQEYLDENTQTFSYKAFRLFVVAGMFLGVSLFLEIYSALKTGCSPGRPLWLVDKSKEMIGFWTHQNIHFFKISYSQISLF